MNQEVFIMGCGAVGTSLGYALQRAGVPISGVFDIDGRMAAKTANQLNVQGYGGSLPDGMRTAQVVLLTVPDDAIPIVVDKALAEELCTSQQIWIHCSGHLSQSIFDGLTGKIRGTGCMHPAFVFPPLVCTMLPENVCFLTDGDEAGLSIVTNFVQRLKGRAITVPGDKRSLYHAAMVMGSNYLVALLSSAAEVLSLAGVPDTDRETLLLDLAGSAISSAHSLGLGSALSGPVRRGDIGVVRDHLQSLSVLPQVRELYALMGIATVRLAERQTGYCPETAETLKEVLGSRE